MRPGLSIPISIRYRADPSKAVSPLLPWCSPYVSIPLATQQIEAGYCVPASATTRGTYPHSRNVMAARAVGNCLQQESENHDKVSMGCVRFRQKEKPPRGGFFVPSIRFS